MITKEGFCPGYSSYSPLLYVMDYKQLSNTIYPDLVNYILNKHGKEMRKFYQTCVDEYLNEEFGELHSGPRNRLTKELMNQLIS